MLILANATHMPRTQMEACITKTEKNYNTQLIYFQQRQKHTNLQHTTTIHERNRERKKKNNEIHSAQMAISNIEKLADTQNEERAQQH